jgi:Domain of unknown function (DUF4184)
VPFTLAHGAAALPFQRCRLVPSALLVGTFAPDFEYFIRLSPDDRFGHTLVGSLILTLPLALLVLWLFHAYVRTPLTRLMPDPVQRRLTTEDESFHFGGASRIALIIASILLGIATHLVWDSFTHSGTWLYYHWPLLSEQFRLPVVGLVPFYKLFQHASTMIGIGALSIWLALWYRATQPSGRPIHNPLSLSGKIVFVTIVSVIASLGAIIRGIAGIGIPDNHVSQKRFLGEVVVTAIALVWWQVVLYGIFTSGRWGRPATPGTGVPVSSTN